MLHTTDVVRLTLTMTTSAGESWRLVEALQSLTEPTGATVGCVGWELSLSSTADDPPRIRYIEDWPGDEELRMRVRSDRFLRLLAVMEKAVSPPEIRFDLAGGTRGFDYVEQARQNRTRHERSEN